MDELVYNPNISPSQNNFIETNFPSFCFRRTINTKSARRNLENSVTDISSQGELKLINENVPDEYRGISLWYEYSDRIMTFKSNGNKMTVIS